MNLIGGPCVGKTTISALLFAQLKIDGYVCEYVQEYAKKLVWTCDFETLNDQYIVSKTQCELLKHINGKVDYIITDGPLIHGIYYNRYNPHNTSNVTKVDAFIQKAISEFRNINIVLGRVDRPYERDGRIESEEESRNINHIMVDILNEYGHTFRTFPAETKYIPDIIAYIKQCTSHVSA